jgi:NAD(P)-dependent dehydrogenase (short-subunit alcohol dehydrogenase family)
MGNSPTSAKPAPCWVGRRHDRLSAIKLAGRASPRGGGLAAAGLGAGSPGGKPGHHLDRHGRCDVFVHAAATFAFGPLEKVALAAWRQVQAVNVESALLLTQAFAPGMRDRGFGRVIFIVSNTFWSPPDGQMLSYVASKGALIGMTRTLAVGLGRDGIAVNARAASPGQAQPATSTTGRSADD